MIELPREVKRIINEESARLGIPGYFAWHSTQEWSAVRLRRAVALRLRYIGFSYPQIGRWLGGRHHTSVISLCRRASSEEKAAALRFAKKPVESSPDPVEYPDLSGEWAI